MLKLKLNQPLTGDIDWVNKVFTSPDYIALIDSLIVDWVVLDKSGYTISRYEITFTTAPNSTVIWNMFIREELDIIGEGTVEFWDIIREIYEELWRNELSRVYEKSRVERMADKSLKRITNKTSEKSRLQSYSLNWLNWLVVLSVDDSSLTWWNIQWVDTEWAILTEDSAYINYTWISWNVFTTEPWIDTILTEGDRIIVGHRIPYGVQKPAEVYMDWYKLEHIDSVDFNFNFADRYTIIRWKNWESYLFLPYSDREYVLNVKYVPDRERNTRENDIVDIPYEYTSTIAYDVLYRILLSREDDRMQWYKTLLYWDQQDPWMLKEYRRYMREMTKQSKWTIKNAIAVQETNRYIRNKVYF